MCIFMAYSAMFETSNVQESLRLESRRGRVLGSRRAGAGVDWYLFRIVMRAGTRKINSRWGVRVDRSIGIDTGSGHFEVYE